MIRAELKKNFRLYLFVVLYLVIMAIVVEWPIITAHVPFRKSAATAHAISAATTTSQTYANPNMFIESVWYPVGWNVSESPDKTNFGFVSPDTHAAIVGLLYPPNFAPNLQSLYTMNEKVMQNAGQTIRSHFTKSIGGSEWLFFEYQSSADGRTLTSRDALTTIHTKGHAQFIKLRLVSDADVFDTYTPVLDRVISTLVFVK